jgi:hypothetical protein
VARVVAFVPDLLFGSRVIGMLQAAGHQAVLVSDLDQVDAGLVDVLVVDLTNDAQARIDRVHAAGMDHTKKLAFYLHTETEVRAAAQQAGFDMVVPRSRMAREGEGLVAGLAPDQ